MREEIDDHLLRVVQRAAERNDVVFLVKTERLGPI